MNKFQSLRAVVLVTLLMSLIITSISAQRPEPTKTEVHGHTMYGVLPPGGIPAIFEPEFTSIKDAEESYYASEPLMVVSYNSETKAYSTWHLDHHEIVNDTIGGTAIAATW